MLRLHFWRRPPMLTEKQYKELTSQQVSALEGKPHLNPIEVLSDGDLLMTDNESKPDYPLGPYILTKDGKIQDVNYHYSNYHK